jgi:hypothetical protein
MVVLGFHPSLRLTPARLQCSELRIPSLPETLIRHSSFRWNDEQKSPAIEKFGASRGGYFTE